MEEHEVPKAGRECPLGGGKAYSLSEGALAAFKIGDYTTRKKLKEAYGSDIVKLGEKLGGKVSKSRFYTDDNTAYFEKPYELNPRVKSMAAISVGEEDVAVSWSNRYQSKPVIQITSGTEIKEFEHMKDVEAWLKKNKFAK